MTTSPLVSPAPFPWARFADRYRNGEWRAEIFADMVGADLAARGPQCTVVDVGCGGGFDGSVELQRRIAGMAARSIGVEPDPDTAVADCFAEVHRTSLEAAPIVAASVDVAFSVMVVEHVTHPDRFLAKVADVLVDGGVFWAFTVDVRHWSSWASVALEKLSVKDFYLDRLRGKRGEDRYSNFPVHYRLNSPAAVARLGADQFTVECLNLFRVGAEDYNLPAALRPVNRALDHLLAAVGAPGSNLAFRAVRRPRGAAP